MKEPILSVENLWKGYREGDREHMVLKDITMGVNKGKKIGIMGPSGSGKTTFLNVVSGLDDVTKGTVTISGNEITSMSIAKRTTFRRKNVGFIFQRFNLVQSLTALENVMLPLLMNGSSRSEAEEKAEEMLERVKILSRKDAYPNKLSGGEEQRVAIIRALIHHPQIIFADEPTGTLDRATSESVLALMDELQEEFNQTMIIVSHDPLVAKQCQRIYHLNGYLKEISKDAI